MESDDRFEARLSAMRPRLHAYCARMVGSAVDGEDLVQDVMVRAVQSRSAGIRIDHLEGWLLRVAHNASLDLLRHRARRSTVPLDEDVHADLQAPPRSESSAIGFRRFLELPALQRCAVVLKDVLGHSLLEIAEIADCSPAAAKSALQRGRLRLRMIACDDKPTMPRLSEDERRRFLWYVDAFAAGNFDAIRALLAEDVELDLVNRLKLSGRGKIAPYFTRYGEASQWRFAFGAVEGMPVMLVHDAERDTDRPAHFVTIQWNGDRIVGIRDFLFASYVMDGADWICLKGF